RASTTFHLDTAHWAHPFGVLRSDASDVETRAVVKVRDVCRLPALLALPRHHMGHRGGLDLIVSPHVVARPVPRIHDRGTHAFDPSTRNDTNVVERDKFLVTPTLECLDVA